MAFPWGGSVTHKELADKFGWFSVIISAILLPFLLVWSKLLAFPKWMVGPLKNGPFYTMKYNISYPENENAFKKHVYDGPVKTSRDWVPAGWTSLMDYEGGKFFECFWGLLQVADIDFNEDRIIISSNFLTWLDVSNVFIEFPKPPVFEHQVRFYFPIMGLNLINPFNWVTSAWAVTSVIWFEKVSNKKFAKENGIHPNLHFLPKNEDPAKIHADKSMTYESPTASGTQVGYGSIS